MVKINDMVVSEIQFREKNIFGFLFLKNVFFLHFRAYNIEYLSKGVVGLDLGIWRLGHNFKLQYLWF